MNYFSDARRYLGSYGLISSAVIKWDNLRNYAQRSSVKTEKDKEDTFLAHMKLYSEIYISCEKLYLVFCVFK